jgi:hypothetical protein
MEGSILPIGLVALVGAMIVMVVEMGSSLRPAACPECGHCQARRAAEELEQERLARDYARRIGLEDDDDRRLG